MEQASIDSFLNCKKEKLKKFKGITLSDVQSYIVNKAY
jgi:hypothetical protein